MSGPKSTRYTLTAEQRKLLAEQNRIIMIREREKARFQRFRAEMTALLDRYSQAEKKTRALIEIAGTGQQYFQAYEDLQQIESAFRQIADGKNADDIERLQEASRSAEKQVILARKKADELQRIIDDNDILLRNEIRDRLSGGLFTSFQFVFDHDATSSQLVEEMAQHLNTMSEDIRLSSPLLARVRRAQHLLGQQAGDAAERNFHAITYLPLIKSCKDQLAEYEQCFQQFDQLMPEYTALCWAMGKQAGTVDCNVKGVQYLTEQIATLAEQKAADDEKRYISQAIDDVMHEMGYPILGRRQVTKRNGARFTSGLYSYDDGTVVSITYADDGKISMELGGVDYEDRIPNEIEQQQLVEEMHVFCGTFSEMERRLAQRGVIVQNRISLLPSDTSSAQIINVQDYHVKQALNVFDARQESHQTTKRKKLWQE